LASDPQAAVAQQLTLQRLALPFGVIGQVIEALRDLPPDPADPRSRWTSGLLAARYTGPVRRGLSDTDPGTERVHLEALRRATPVRRIQLALSLSRSVISLSRDGLARRLEHASPEEVGLRFLALHYGADLADEVRADLVTRRR
jgi:hypothetical protein